MGRMTYLLAILLAAQLELGGHILNVELAETETKQLKGLMQRSELPEGSGMLFVYDHPKVLTFWMKDTHIPLSIGFFDEEKRLINTQEMAPDKEFPLYKSKRAAKYALELPKGWFHRHNIQPGTKFLLKE